jgi:hypothetical protein
MRRARFIFPVSVLAAIILVSVAARPTAAQAWPGFARDAQHTALGVGPSQLPEKIRWSTPVDQSPQYSGSDLLIHYGSPLITRVNTVIVPVKTGATGGFEVLSLRASDGGQLWTVASDYVVPPHNWFPEFGVTLTPKDATLVMPAAGGTVLVRNFPDSPNGTTTRVAFYGIANYTINQAAFNSAIQICTPISSDRLGNLYFGFVSTGAALPGYPTGIPSGLARISSRGVGTFVSAAAMSDGGSSMVKVVYNNAPGFSIDGNSLYVAVDNAAIGGYGNGYLCRLDSTTLAKQSSVLLMDPRPGYGYALITDDGSGAPTIGPDGDVYFGVLEANFGSNHLRGWLLHYSGDLGTTKLPNAFGWDDTASIVPASLVPSYNGTSSYLLLTKYNNYVAGGGDGVNKLAVVDPNVAMTDNTTGTPVQVMNTVITVTGPTPDMSQDLTQHPNAVREWCINTAAIDPAQKCAVVNSEDGYVYRWDFTTNTLSAGVSLAQPTGEAYTPTIMGPDGAVYAINNATLFSLVKY